MKTPEAAKEGARGEVLVCFAVKEEAGAFQKIVAGKDGVYVLVTGIGQENAEKAVRDFLAKITPASVLSCGFCGRAGPRARGRHGGF